MKVIYDTMAFIKIMHWVEKAKHDEVSGFGKVILDSKEGVLRVTDAIMLPQRNGSGHTDIEAADLGKAEYLLKDTPGELRLWWHSHVKMQCFWSGTDMETIRLLGKHGWFLATVFNQHWQKRSAYYQGETGNAPEIFLDELPTSHVFYKTKAITDPWDEEFTKNVKTVSVTRNWPSYSRGGYYGGELTQRQIAEFPYRWKVKDLTKRQKKVIAQGSKRNGPDRLLALVETENYGTLVITKGDEFGIYATHKDNPSVKTHLIRKEIFTDARKILWASPDTIDSWLKWSREYADLGTGYPEATENLKKLLEGNYTEIKRKKEEKETSPMALLPAVASSKATEDEVSRVDEAVLDAAIQETLGRAGEEDESDDYVSQALISWKRGVLSNSPFLLGNMRKMYPYWDTLEEEDQANLLDYYMSDNRDLWGNEASEDWHGGML